METIDTIAEAPVLMVPDELLLMILNFLEEKDVVRVSCVCKWFRSVCTDSDSWDRFYVPVCSKPVKKYCPSGKRNEKSVEQYYCDYCTQYVSKDSKHKDCKKCKSVFCSTITGGPKTEECIKCLHSLDKTHCGQPWKSCRKTLQVVKVKEEPVISCMTKTCQLCDKVCLKLKVRATVRTGSQAVNKEICEECDRTTYLCRCAKKDCECSMYAVWHRERRFVCDHCLKQNHCAVIVKPADVEEEEWVRYGYTGLNLPSAVKGFGSRIKGAVDVDLKNRKCKGIIAFLSVMSQHKPYFESLTDSMKNSIRPGIDRYISVAQANYVEQLTTLRNLVLSQS